MLYHSNSCRRDIQGVHFGSVDSIALSIFCRFHQYRASTIYFSPLSKPQFGRASLVAGCRTCACLTIYWKLSNRAAVKNTPTLLLESGPKCRCVFQWTSEGAVPHHNYLMAKLPKEDCAFSHPQLFVTLSPPSHLSLLSVLIPFKLN